VQCIWRNIANHLIKPPLGLRKAVEWFGGLETGKDEIVAREPGQPLQYPDDRWGQGHSVRNILLHALAPERQERPVGVNLMPSHCANFVAALPG
jgi:hypothetical protein